MAHISRAFLARTQQLANQFVAASDELGACAAEFTHRTGTEAHELAGGAIDLDTTPVLAAQLQAFYTTLGGLLAPLTPEQKAAIYALKS